MVPLENAVLPLNSETLMELICSDCKNYLSVGPVLMHNRSIICGRCNLKKQYENKDLHFSLYNALAEKCFFKCVNHFHGCREILLFNEAKAHEDNCKFVHIYNCFCKFEGNGCQFIHHVSKNHAKYYAAKGTFKINLKNSLELSKRIFYNSNNIFRIETRIIYGELEIWCQPENKSLELSCGSYKIRFFSARNYAEYISPSLPFILSLSQKRVSRTFKTTLRKLEQLLISDVVLITILIDETVCAAQEIFNVVSNLSKRYLIASEQAGKNKSNLKVRDQTLLLREKEIVTTEERLSTYKNQIKIGEPVTKLISWIFNNSLICSNCNKEILKNRFNVYLCPKWHITCDICQKRNCKVCKKLVNLTSVKTILEEIEFICDWRDCEKTTKYWNFLLHKQVCPYRLYKCPLLYCKFEGTKSQLISHWHSNDILLYTGTEFQWSFNTLKSKILSHYLIIDNVNEMLFVTLTIIIRFTRKSSESYIELKIDEDKVIFLHNYKLFASYFYRGFCRGKVEFMQNFDSKEYHWDLAKEKLDAIKISVDYMLC